jgi:hypothetical protein
MLGVQLLLGAAGHHEYFGCLAAVFEYVFELILRNSKANIRKVYLI